MLVLVVVTDKGSRLLQLGLEYQEVLPPQPRESPLGFTADNAALGECSSREAIRISVAMSSHVRTVSALVRPGMVARLNA